jgi:hypothetical protein
MARTEIAPPVQPQTDARRSRRLAFGLTLAGAGVIALFSSLPEVDVSTTRFFMFVGGAVALAVGLLVVSWRMAAALVLVFTVAVAAEGPVRGDDAAAVRLLERTGLPSAFHPTARGFQGNGRAFPYRVFAGSTSSIDPEMVRIPSGFSRVPLGFDFASQIYGRPIQSGSSTTLREDGYAPIATWERTEPTGRVCQIELDAADPVHVTAVLAGAGDGLRSAISGKVIVRLLSFCSAKPTLENRRPGKGATTPVSEQTPLVRGGPR